MNNQDTLMTLEQLEELSPIELGGVLLYAIKSSFNTQYIKNIINSGAFLEALDNLGRTALHYAAYYCRVEVIKALLAAGASLEARDIDGWTPLHWAARCESIEVVQILLEAGANKNAKTNAGSTSLHFAVNRGNIGVIGALIKAGASLDARNNNSIIPWNLARPKIKELYPQLNPNR